MRSRFDSCRNHLWGRNGSGNRHSIIVNFSDWNGPGAGYSGFRVAAARPGNGALPLTATGGGPAPQNLEVYDGLMATILIHDASGMCLLWVDTCGSQMAA